MRQAARLTVAGELVWPRSQTQRGAVLPLPKGTTFSNR